MTQTGALNGSLGCQLTIWFVRSWILLLLQLNGWVQDWPKWLFRWTFFPFSMCFQLRSKTSPCIFLAALHFVSEKTRTKHWSMHNERNKANKSISAQKIQENVSLLNWKVHAKIQVLLKERKFARKSHLGQSCTKPFNCTNELPQVVKMQ